MGKNSGYSYKRDLSIINSCRAKAANMRIHFKNTVEVAAVLRGMTISRATAFLKNVIDRKECVPFRKFNGGVGRTAQAKAFGTTQGRWPQKSAKFLLELLRNAVSNAEFIGLDCDTLYVAHVQANPAKLNRRRTYRAHGRITPYMGHHCHLQLTLKEKEN